MNKGRSTQHSLSSRGVKTKITFSKHFKKNYTLPKTKIVEFYEDQMSYIIKNHPEHKKQLSEWKIVIKSHYSKDEATAYTDFTNKTIYLNPYFLQVYRNTNVEKNNFIHEIAHVIAGYKHNHDNYFFNISKKLGGQTKKEWIDWGGKLNE